MSKYLIKNNELQGENDDGVIDADGGSKTIVAYADDWGGETAAINIHIGGKDIPLKRQSDGSDLAFTADAAEIIDHVGQGLQVSVTGVDLGNTDNLNIGLF